MEELEQVLLECEEISYPSDTGPNDLFSTPTPCTVALPALSMHMQKTPSGVKPGCCERVLQQGIVYGRDFTTD